jgi:hypothetical protein
MPPGCRSRRAPVSTKAAAATLSLLGEERGDHREDESKVHSRM